MARRSTRGLAAGLALAAAGVIGVLSWRGTDVDRAAHGERAQRTTSDLAEATARARLAASAPDPVGTAAAPLPGSLEGTEADGELAADAAGHLVLTRELRRLFDHFLVASGEEPIATMRARILAVLRERLPAMAAAEAIELLDRYLAYREAARGLVPVADPAAGLDQVHALRVKLFSPAVVQAFFAEEEAATYAALARRDVLLDPTLRDPERARRLAEIDARTPLAVRQARAAALAPVAQLHRDTELRAAGASDPQIAAARTAALGPEAAARLAELDRAHGEWEARLARFRAERDALRADPRLDDAERGRQLAALLERSFTAPERLRVEALDRLSSRAAPP